MSTIYHPEYDQLLEFSAGTLEPSISLCVSVHLEYCEQCRLQLAKMDTLGGIMFEQLSSEPADDALLDTIFERIDSKQASSAGQVQFETACDSDIPDPVKKLVGYDLDSLKWRKHGSRVKSATLIEHDGLKASLIRINAGAAIPKHDHRGKEYTVILSGSFSDNHGVYKRGDFVVCRPGEPHSPTATADQDCLCLAVLDAPMRFANPVVELINRFSPL